MNRIVTAALSGLILTAAASGATAQTNKLTMQDKMFMSVASEGNVSEVKTAKLALTKTKSKDVMMVAQTIIKGHTTAQADLMSLAKTKDVALPMAPNAKHKRAYAMLSKMAGASFDKAYLQGQVRDHYATVDTFNEELTKGQDSNVRGFATKYLPDIQAHTVMIDKAAMSHGAKTPAKFSGKMSAMKM